MLTAMTMKPGKLIPSLREFAISLGIIAVLMRVLIAPGFMPDLDAVAQGDFKLIICSAGSLTTIPADINGDTPENGHGDQADLCPFAALSHVAMLADLPQLGDGLTGFIIEEAANRGAITAPAARIPEARAPPIFS